MCLVSVFGLSTNNLTKRKFIHRVYGFNNNKKKNSLAWLSNQGRGVEKQLTLRISTSSGIDRSPRLRCLELLGEGSEVASVVKGTSVARKHRELVRNPIFHFRNPSRGVDSRFSFQNKEDSATLQIAMLTFDFNTPGENIT